MTRSEALGKMLCRGFLPIILPDELPVMLALEQIDALAGHGEAFHHQFARTTEETVGLAETRTQDLRQSLNAASVAVGEALSRTVVTTQAQFAATTEASLAAFETRSQEQISALTGHAQCFSEQFARLTDETVGQAETRTRDLRQSMEEIGRAVTEALGRNVTATQEQFEELFQALASTMGFQFRPEPIGYLIQRHYRQTDCRGLYAGRFGRLDNRHAPQPGRLRSA